MYGEVVWTLPLDTRQDIISSAILGYCTSLSDLDLELLGVKNPSPFLGSKARFIPLRLVPRSVITQEETQKNELPEYELGFY